MADAAVEQNAPMRMITPREAAANLFNQGMVLAQRQDDAAKQMAYRLFCSSVDADPTLHQGWFAVGNANADMHMGEAAVACHRRVLELQPNDPLAWVNLGHQLYHRGILDEARSATLRALEIDPDNAYALTNLSCIQSSEGQLEESLESAKKAFALSKQPVIEFALGMAYLHLREWKLGLKHLAARFAYAKRMQHFGMFPYPKWNGESLRGKTLFLVADQGLGDTISFFRFMKMLDERAKGGHIVAQFQPDIMRLCTQGFLDWELKNTLIGPMPQPFPAADYWLSTTDIPTALQLTNAEIEQAKQPTVGPVPKPAGTAWKANGRRLHVGVAWAGSADNDIDRWRSFQVTDLLELYRVAGIQLYSVQMGPRAQELHQRGCATLVRDLSPFIRDVVDTLSIMRDLDLVVSVESSVAHMAGLLGIDCIVPYSFHGRDWRIGIGDKPVLWCPNHRIVKQGPDANWRPVFQKIADIVQKRVHG